MKLCCSLFSQWHHLKRFHWSRQINPFRVRSFTWMRCNTRICIFVLYSHFENFYFSKQFWGNLLDFRDQRNVIEAAFVGASQAIPLVLNIGGNLIAFLSLLAAINGFLGWFGGLLDYPQLSFEVYKLLKKLYNKSYISKVQVQHHRCSKFEELSELFMLTFSRNLKQLTGPAGHQTIVVWTCSINEIGYFEQLLIGRFITVWPFWNRLFFSDPKYAEESI